MTDLKHSKNPYFLMLWKWFEDRGALDRACYSEGLSPEDFKTMLDEHEAGLIDLAERSEAAAAKANTL